MTSAKINVQFYYERPIAQALQIGISHSLALHTHYKVQIMLLYSSLH